LLGLAAHFVVYSETQDSLTLPQAPQVGRVGDAALAAARNWFGPGHDTGVAGDVPVAIHTVVVGALPPAFQTSCAHLMDEWLGDRGRDSSVWQVRLVDRHEGFVWLALVCGSSSSDSEMMRYRDERLARLRLADGQVQVPALSVDDDSRDGVRRVEQEGQVPVLGATGLAFRVYFDDNPCCDGPESRSQTRTVVFVETPAGVREALSVITARDNISHSEAPDVDVETKYEANLTFDRDAAGLVTGAHATFRDRLIETTWSGDKASTRTTRDRAGTLRFRWNSAALVFEPVKRASSSSDNARKRAYDLAPGAN
jgi:hypothetical protein